MKRLRTRLARGRSERYKVREMEEKPTRNAKIRNKSKKSAIFETPVLSSSLSSSSSSKYAERLCAVFVSLFSKRRRRDLKFFIANTLNSYAKDTTTDFAYVLLKNILRSAAKRILKVHTSHSIHKTEEEPI